MLSTTIRVITVVKMLCPQQILTTVMTHIIVDETIHHTKPHSICFLPQYQRNEIFVLTTENSVSDLKVHVLHYANELLIRVRLFFEKLWQTRLNMQKQFEKMLGKRVMTHTHYR